MLRPAVASVSSARSQPFQHTKLQREERPEKFRFGRRRQGQSRIHLQSCKQRRPLEQIPRLDGAQRRELSRNARERHRLPARSMAKRAEQLLRDELSVAGGAN
jgi:hypothetical protein